MNTVEIMQILSIIDTMIGEYIIDNEPWMRVINRLWNDDCNTITGYKNGIKRIIQMENIDNTDICVLDIIYRLPSEKWIIDMKGIEMIYDHLYMHFGNTVKSEEMIPKLRLVEAQDNVSDTIVFRLPNQFHNIHALYEKITGHEPVVYLDLEKGMMGISASTVEKKQLMIAISRKEIKSWWTTLWQYMGY